MSDPTITIASRKWRVPLLAPRQNRIVLPLLCAGARDYASLAEICYMALTRAHAIARHEFDELPIPLCELIEAVPVVAMQTGFMERRAARSRARAPELPDWDAIVAQCCNFRPGTTEEYYEDNLTAPRLFALREEWRKHPPLPVLAAAWLGYTPPPREEEAIAELLKLFPDGVIRAGAAVR